MKTEILDIFDHELKDILQKRELPGIFVVEATGNVVFASEEGRKFLLESGSKMKQGESGPFPRGQYGQYDTGFQTVLLPDALRDFTREVCKQIPSNGSSPRLSNRRSMLFQSEAGHYYVVVALALAQSGASGRRRLILLVVQRVGQRKQFNPERLGKLYGLTKREQEVVMRLVHGDSNKEIATSLHIQEYTVKDHLKHIMAKCQADSRVSVISKVLDV
jgi:DNA-binding CsgD family transcriptional regulator